MLSQFGQRMRDIANVFFNIGFRCWHKSYDKIKSPGEFQVIF